MISLKKARTIADKYENIPRYSSLRGWKMRGVISGITEMKKEGKAGGRYGLYNDLLPVEIITTQRLKGKYTLSEIADIRGKMKVEKIIKSESKKDIPGVLKMSAFIYQGDITEIQKQIKNETDPQKITELANKIVNAETKYKLAKDYADEFIKALEEVEI